MSSDPKFFRLMARVTNRKGEHRVRIGSGTAFHSEFGSGMVCTIETIPLNWDGEFIIVPNTRGEEKGETE